MTYFILLCSVYVVCMEILVYFPLQYFHMDSIIVIVMFVVFVDSIHSFSCMLEMSTFVRFPFFFLLLYGDKQILYTLFN